ncbi:ArsR/SmtB family transcription factor [Sphingomonas aracearum]|uniref:Transcriptional regulator n=1 Tax=Sphingomonas aracearum TaxID=2283317 RepID=A0A369VWV3_9SPHN|nr:helix-turn-helix domain-containing protein [Sphingomonas aracearum]RDE06866.1 transcriptional regulator [Sphingomonas aracearum]
MSDFVHPRLTDVSLAAALHALADPVRLDMVATLAGSPDLNCAGTGACSVPKSTLSNHFKVLRNAGLIESRADGRDQRNRLRRAEFDARFPGLLDSVLANRPA